MNYTTIKKIGIAVIIGFLVIFVVDIVCPIEFIFGIPCPGCGMSSALYHLFHFDLKTAMFFHPLVLGCCLYFIGIGIAYFYYHNFENKVAKILTTIFMIALLVVYVYRMIYIYPNYPMMFNEHSLLGRILQWIK